jgi:hypothetical protein
MPWTFPELPGWTFDSAERSAGAYRVFGRDQLGRAVETTGSEAEMDELIEHCRVTAMNMMAAARASGNDSRER